MIGTVLAVLILAADPPPRSLDVEFAAAVEAWAAGAAPRTAGDRGDRLIDALDAERYSERAAAGKQLLAICVADPDAARRLVRIRSIERRPEARYWINRILRELNRCETCEGAGYCREYRPRDIEPLPYSGIPCRRCGRWEWQHGLQWSDGNYSYLACAECGGSGTFWNHYAVD